MQLYSSPFSPFGRKVRACAVARDIDRQITVHSIDANQAVPELWAINPLGKIPALVTVDRVGMFDSRVICEYLDTVGDAPALFPPHGGLRWRALLLQSLADGIMDAAVLRRGEVVRADPREATLTRQKAKVDRGLAELEATPPHRVTDIGVISVACALGYLDARFAHEPWREAHPTLAAWHAEVAAQPWYARTDPAAT